MAILSGRSNRGYGRRRRRRSRNTTAVLFLVSLLLLAIKTTVHPGNCFGSLITHAFVINARPVSPIPLVPLQTSSTARMAEASLRAPRVWIEEAEDGFVDEEENLEPGEVCLRSVKSFASGVRSEGAVSDRATTETNGQTPSMTIRVDFEVSENETNDEDTKRFLSAGALLQRPRYDLENNPTATGICDAWVGDSFLNDGGPNLQLKGALLVIDDLFLNHLKREKENHRLVLDHEKKGSNGKAPTPASETGGEENTHEPVEDDSWAIRALRNFVIHCGDEEDVQSADTGEWRSTSHAAASAMAAVLRGFVPLRDMTQKSSIYDVSHYDGDLSGLVLDPGSDRYRSAAAMAVEAESGDLESNLAGSIAKMLPSEETVARHTTKRFTINKRKQG